MANLDKNICDFLSNLTKKEKEIARNFFILGYAMKSMEIDTEDQAFEFQDGGNFRDAEYYFDLSDSICETYALILKQLRDY